jgi:hypothetical protein
VKEGREIVERVLAAADRPGGLFVKSKLDIAEKRFDERDPRLARRDRSAPDWAKAHFLLGSALALSGERTAARTDRPRASRSTRPSSTRGACWPTCMPRSASTSTRWRRAPVPEEAQRHRGVRLRVAQSLMNLDRVDEGAQGDPRRSTSRSAMRRSTTRSRASPAQGRLDVARKYFEKALAGGASPSRVSAAF